MKALTNTAEYADYLVRHQLSWKSQFFQIPYRLHLKQLRLGRTLEIGCGAGRNLVALNAGSVGIDHNLHLVNACRQQGLMAWTTEQWPTIFQTDLSSQSFDSILLAHVAEHLSATDFANLIRDYTPYLKPSGRFVVICPQELGYQMDQTHLEFVDFEKIESAFAQSTQNYSIERKYSFPFPRWAGKKFPYNEFVVVASRIS